MKAIKGDGTFAAESMPTLYSTDRQILRCIWTLFDLEPAAREHLCRVGYCAFELSAKLETTGAAAGHDIPDMELGGKSGEAYTRVVAWWSLQARRSWCRWIDGLLVTGWRCVGVCLIVWRIACRGLVRIGARRRARRWIIVGIVRHAGGIIGTVDIPGL